MREVSTFEQLFGRPRSDVLNHLEHGALYPALQRLEDRGWISAKWGTSSNNRKARFYTLTTRGRTELAKATSRWNRLAQAIGRILGTQAVGG